MGELSFSPAGRIDPEAFVTARVLLDVTGTNVNTASKTYTLNDAPNNYDVLWCVLTWEEDSRKSFDINTAGQTSWNIGYCYGAAPIVSSFVMFKGARNQWSGFSFARAQNGNFSAHIWPSPPLSSYIPQGQITRNLTFSSWSSGSTKPALGSYSLRVVALKI